MEQEKNTVNDDLNLLGKIKKECELKEEDTLQYYCVCLLKLYKEFIKVEKTEMLSYIHQIVSPAFPLVLKYFLIQANAYLLSGEAEEKSVILQDIEISVETFGEVWDAVIQSTNAADRILIQSAPIESTIRQVPVKLCAYYSSLLNELATIFQEKVGEERKYAFSVYPSLGSRPEAILLFLTMKRNGKVGIIRVPEKDIEDVKYLRMLISHEFYHIVPGSFLRRRRSRAAALAKIILYDLREKLLDGIKINQKVRERLEECLFGDVPREIKEKYLSKDEESRCFYSTDTSEFFSNYFIQHALKLLKMDSQEIWEAIFAPQDINDFEKYKSSKDCAEDYHKRIKNKILNLLASSSIPKVCKFYSDVFREVFADLLYVMSLQVSANDYFSSFRYKPLNVPDSQYRPNLYLRASLVLEIMTEDSAEKSLDEKLFNDWREWRETTLNENTESNTDSFVCEVRSFLKDITDSANIKYSDLAGEEETIGAECVSTLPDLNIWDNYIEYFRLCRNRYYDFEKQRKIEFINFRKKYLIEMNYSNLNLLDAISKRKWEDIQTP